MAYNNRNNDFRGGPYTYDKSKISYERREPKKKSGAKMGIQSKGINEGKIYISAWKANKRHGLVKITAFENARSTRSESQAGNKFCTMMFEIFYQDSGSKVLEIAPYNMTSGKVFLEKLGWVVSTKARNGGYVGKVS